MGNKVTARRIAADYGLPLVRGSRGLQPGSDLIAASREIGFPVLITGVKSNIPVLLAALESPEFAAGQPNTGLLLRIATE
jgi:biotin carboxylase